MAGKDLLSISDLSPEDIRLLITSAVDMKSGGWTSSLGGKVLALVFEKPSLRTRLGFEIAMRQLGGQTVCLSPDEIGLEKRESVPDVARVLCRYADAVTVRTFSHRTLEALAAYSSVPVINALSNLEHPCQALADFLTIYEKKGGFTGLTVAYIGDGNSVANSLLLTASQIGVNFRMACPDGYQLPENILRRAQEYAAGSGAVIVCTGEPRLAVSGADVVYTDAWTSLEQEAEAGQRRQVFAGYQVNEALLALARADAIFMHPLPVHRGEEVSGDIPDCRQSVVFDQAENHLHLQKALLAGMLGGLEIPLANY